MVNLPRGLAKLTNDSQLHITSSLAKFSENHCSTRVSLGWFQNEGVSSNSGQGDRPQRNHSNRLELGVK